MEDEWASLARREEEHAAHHVKWVGRSGASIFALLALCSLNLDLAVGHSKIGGNWLLCLEVLAEADGLFTVEAVEESDLHNAWDSEELRRQSVDFPDTLGTLTVDAGGQLARQQEWLKRGVDNPHAIVRHALSSLAGQSGAHGGLRGAHGVKAVEHAGSGQGQDLDRDGLPLGAESVGLLAGV